MINLDLDVSVKTLQIMLLGWGYDIDEVEEMPMERLLGKIKQILEAYCEEECFKTAKTAFMSSDKITVNKYLDFLQRKEND